MLKIFELQQKVEKIQRSFQILDTVSLNCYYTIKDILLIPPGQLNLIRPLIHIYSKLH